MLTTLALVSLQALAAPAPPPTAAPAATASTDWPTWRGRAFAGVAAADARPPLEWSEMQNVRWKVALPGLGCSSPVVRGDHIYLTAAIDLEAVPDGEEPGPQPGPPVADHLHRFIVLALDRATGAEVWRTTVCEARPHEKEHETGSHASASVTCGDEGLVAFFGSRGLHGLSLDGELRWSKTLGQMKTLASFGEGSTPARHADTVVVQWDEEGPSFVAAFDVGTGEERWRVVREVDSSWGSPAIAVVAGRPHVILNGSDVTRARDLATGAVIWSCDAMSKNPTTSPLVHDGVVYVMNSYLGNVTQAIRLTDADGAASTGDLTGTEAILWTRARGAAYVPSPLASGGRLYYLRDSTGVLNCVDARTGAPLYSPARLGDIRRIHASPMAAAGRIYIVSREAGTVVLEDGDAFKVLAQNDLDDVFDASPAAIGDALYLRGRSHLYCLGE